MAAFLTVNLQRAHAALGLPLDQAPARLFPVPLPRSVLARGLVATDGRLVCRWQTDVSAPFGSPPH